MKALYEKHRPAKIGKLLGTSRKLAEALRRMADGRGQLAILITGPSGTGKTTISRLLAQHLTRSPMDIHEYNVGSIRGVDFIRDLESNILLSSWGGAWRAFIFEEAHNLTTQAQEALLRLTEHYPLKRALIFTSTNSEAFTSAFRSRMMPVELSRIGKADLSRLLKSVAGAESIRLSPAARNLIIEASDGNARSALNQLDWYGASGQLPTIRPGLEPVATVGRSAALKAWDTRRRNSRIA